MGKSLSLLTAMVLALWATGANAQIEVNLSGNARFGLDYDSARMAPVAKAQFNARARMEIEFRGVADNGLRFGANFRIDQAGGAAGNTAMTEGDVFISGAFGRLSMGDVGSAAEWAIGEFFEIGYTGLEMGPEFLGNGWLAGGTPTSVLYEYELGGFRLFAGSDQLQSGPVKSQISSIGASYSFDRFTVGLGHETGRSSGTKVRHTVGGVEAAIDPYSILVMYGHKNLGGASFKQYGASASATLKDHEIAAYYMRRFDTSRNVGVGYSYDLGKGAVLGAGVNRSSHLGVTTRQADLGLKTHF